MKSIQLPVRVEREEPSPEWYHVIQKNGDVLVPIVTKSESDQIVLALNLHNELVAALKPFSDCDPTNVGNIPDEMAYLWKPTCSSKDLPGISVAHIKEAMAVLKKLKP